MFSAVLGLPFGYRVPVARCLTLLPIVAGVALACYHKDAQTSAGGVVLTMLSAAVSALTGILTNFILVQHAGSISRTRDLHRGGVEWQPHVSTTPLDLVRAVSPLAALYMLPLAWWVEGSEAHRFLALRWDGSGIREVACDPLVWLLCASGLGAFFLNSLSFMAAKQVAPLTLTVLGCAKQVLMIILSTHLFGTVLSAANRVGVVLALGGTLLYSHYKAVGGAGAPVLLGFKAAAGERQQVSGSTI